VGVCRATGRRDHLQLHAPLDLDSSGRIKKENY
jgi:hypothetical protein